MLEEPRPVYRIAIVLALIIFISSVTLVSADDNVTSTITETADVTVLNETITESLTEAVPIDTTLQPTEKITPEQITQTPVTKDTDVEPDQITDTVPVANIESGLNDQSLVNHIKIVSGKSDITSFIANNRVLKSTSTKNNNIALKNRLDSYGVQSLDELPISSSIEKFDVVTVDSKNFYEQLKTSQGITFTIDGIDYPAEFSRMNFDTIDDGIDSYQGRLVGSDNSEILFTVSENALLGYITLGNKTYWIEPVTQKNGNNCSVENLQDEKL